MSSADKNIEEILKAASNENKLSCIKVFEIINENSFFPDITGIAMNENKLKITVCQLGLFGYPEGKKIPVCESVPDDLKDKIYENIENEKLPCAAAWNIAAEMKLKKPDIAAACERLGIKINRCQLGAF